MSASFSSRNAFVSKINSTLGHSQSSSSTENTKKSSRETLEIPNYSIRSPASTSNPSLANSSNNLSIQTNNNLNNNNNNYQNQNFMSVQNSIIGGMGSIKRKRKAKLVKQVKHFYFFKKIKTKMLQSKF
jgi:hypothetical protein